MKLIIGLLIGIVLGMSGQLAAELMDGNGQPYTMWQNGMTPQQYEQQQRYDTTNQAAQQFFLNQNQRGPC